MKRQAEFQFIDEDYDDDDNDIYDDTCLFFTQSVYLISYYLNTGYN